MYGNAFLRSSASRLCSTRTFLLCYFQVENGEPVGQAAERASDAPI
jgi:hypothetical protein